MLCLPCNSYTVYCKLFLVSRILLQVTDFMGKENDGILQEEIRKEGEESGKSRFWFEVCFL